MGTVVRAHNTLESNYWIPATASSRSVEDAAFLSQSRLFAGISAADCRSLAAAANTREYSSDKLIYEQDQPARHVLLILFGCVKLTQIGSDGSEVILWLHGALDAIGVFGIPARNAHSCSARAILDSRVLIWDWARLNQTPSGPQILQNIGHIVSDRLGELEERFREVATVNVGRRVASAIGRISRHVGRTTREGTEISLSREELAQLTGTTVFSVSRLISRWSELGIIRPGRESFVVLDFERLATISAGSEDSRVAGPFAQGSGTRPF